MNKKRSSPDVEKAPDILEKLWYKTLQEEEFPIDRRVDQIINSKFVSIRYCLPTQILGKLSNPQLDCLCLQKGDSNADSKWDPRSFAIKVIVPWVADNQNVLGTSGDPYVSKPLRRESLESNPKNVKGKKDWALLYEILNEIESKDSEDFTRDCMISVLRSVHKKLQELTFTYHIPERISLDQTEKLIETFLAESSGGDRGLSVAAALFETFACFFSNFDKVERHVINASDDSTGQVSDIECVKSDGEIVLAVEVKERNLTFLDVQDALLNARTASLKEFLFNAPDTNPSEEDKITELINKAWASGTNLYRLSIFELIRVGLTLTGEEGRKIFLQNVGNQLDMYNTQPRNRQEWKKMLESL